MDKLLNRLVENAIDFLRHAVDELETDPKYSVIHFHTAVEQFLKARLMHEHWALIVSKRNEPDLERFLAGDFQSVTLDEAAARLKKVVGSGLSPHELEMFRDVARHRNRIMHFFHAAHSAEEGDKLKQAIAKQQLAAWYLLHQLLRVRWKDVFETWSEDIAAVDRALRKHHAFLQIVFDHLTDEIRQRTSKGQLFAACPSCGFDAQKRSDEMNDIYDAECLVCDLTQRCLDIECDVCSTVVRFVSEGFGECDACKKVFEPQDVAKILDDSASALIAAMEGDDTWALGNCGECDGYETLVRREDDSYLCTSCFGRFESVEWCQWCNTPNTGDMEHSYYSGCNVCDGKAGWDADKDD